MELGKNWKHASEIFLLALVLVLVTSSTLAEESLEERGVRVHLNGFGTLAGSFGISRTGLRYLQFRGVPYATPPVGDLRFRFPTPPQPWSGLLNAVTPPSVCIQNPYMQASRVTGSEDCLYLSIFTRNLQPTAKRPVFVFLHGGAFIFGGTTLMTGEYLMDQDLVFVTVQYRLGPFGFLSTGDSEAPGNLGLHDQLTALHWVQDHIGEFGGDPNLVTLGGLSAGAASTHYLLLSKKSVGLFHRALLLSGSSLCWWASLPKAEETSEKLALLLDCPTHPSTALIHCLRSKSAEEVMEAQGELYSWHPGTLEREPMNIWSPRLDPEAGEDALLPVSVQQAVLEGRPGPKVPMLVGVDETEGAWRGVNILGNEVVLNDFIQEYQNVLPLVLGLGSQMEEEAKVVEMLSEAYMGISSLKRGALEAREEEVSKGLVDMMGDSMFNLAINEMVKLHSETSASPLWMYVYNVTHQHSLPYMDVVSPGLKKTPALEVLQRPTHASEATMLFPILTEILGPLSEEEVEQSRRLIKLFYNFMLDGKPGEFEGWQPFAGSNQHLVIGNDGSHLNAGLPFQERMRVWQSLQLLQSQDHNSPKEEL